LPALLACLAGDVRVVTETLAASRRDSVAGYA